MENFGSYKAFETSTEYEQIDLFLRLNDSIIRMETASELKRPALEGIQIQLRTHFGELICGDSDRQKNIRKWTGRLVRKVMEDHGYKIQGGSAVRLLDRPNNVFKTGTRYEKR